MNVCLCDVAPSVGSSPAINSFTSTAECLEHVRALSGEILCKSASLQLLSKLNGEDVLFMCGRIPRE